MTPAPRGELAIVSACARAHSVASCITPPRRNEHHADVAPRTFSNRRDGAAKKKRVKRKVRRFAAKATPKLSRKDLQTALKRLPREPTRWQANLEQAHGAVAADGAAADSELSAAGAGGPDVPLEEASADGDSESVAVGASPDGDNSKVCTG